MTNINKIYFTINHLHYMPLYEPHHVTQPQANGSLSHVQNHIQTFLPFCPIYASELNFSFSYTAQTKPHTLNILS